MMNKRIGLLEHALFHFIPLKKQVLFISFEGRQYGDNPKHIAKYIHQVRPEIQLYWTINEETDISQIPTYFRTVKYGTTKYQFIKNRSSIIVSNGAGNMLMALSGFKRLYKPFISKNEQFELATWHGCPFKVIGKDIPNSPFNENNLYSSADILIASSYYEESIFKHAFCNRIPTDTLGYARNDCLFQTNDKKELKKRLNIPQDKKVLLYAPTFREDDVYMSGINQMNSIDIDSLLRKLSSCFGGEWVFVYRFHNLVFNHELMKSISAKENMIDGSISDDMADYLQISDLLLTDYSGSVFDVVGTDIPCFLYIPDYEKYCSSRGLYFDVNDLPFPKAQNDKELFAIIESFDLDSYKDDVRSFSKQLGFVNDAYSSKRICEKYLIPRL